jgi:phosphotransferase system enzyme I (PtsI)
VVIDPSETILAEYRKRQASYAAERKRLKGLKTTAAMTLDGVAIELHANIEGPGDLDHVKANGATGVGLYRSEFLFLGRDDLPSEDEQYRAYRAVIEGMKGAPVTIRTIDLGRDKMPKWADAETMSAPNPALGLTGVRLCLAEPLLFRTQLRALLRAGRHGKLKLLVPMLAHLSEVSQVLFHVEQARESLREEAIDFADDVEIGGMIEVPGAAITVGHLLDKLDFVSIGTNDLIQYTLAVDRGDDAVSHLYDPFHPAVLSLIGHVIRTADKAGVPVSVCGEMAGDVRLTRLLLALGLRRFSMHPAQMLNVKQIILKSDLSKLAILAAEIEHAPDADSVREILAGLS